jgi:hypothetical protein
MIQSFSAADAATAAIGDDLDPSQHVLRRMT